MIDLGLDNTELHRGATQFATGIIWGAFGLVMLYQSWHRYKLGWPIRWRMLVGAIMLASAFKQGAHGVYWLGWTDHDLTSWQLVIPLWTALVLSAWCFVRWVRVGDDE